MVPFVVLMIVLLSATHVASPVGPEIARARRVLAYWNKPIILIRVDARVPKLHPSARYGVSVKPMLRPSIHPRGETVHELSLVILHSHVTPKLNKAIIFCGANGTRTTLAQWGLFNIEQFASDRVQAEYYVSVKRSMVNKWLLNVSEFVKSGEMTKCVKETMHEFQGEVRYAKKATISEVVKNGLLGEQAWVIWVIVALSTVVVVELVIVVWLRARRKRILARRNSLLRDASSIEEGQVNVDYDAVRAGHMNQQTR